MKIKSIGLGKDRYGTYVKAYIDREEIETVKRLIDTFDEKKEYDFLRVKTHMNTNCLKQTSWIYSNKIAKALHMGKNECHKAMIEKYGPVKMEINEDGEEVIKMIIKFPKQELEEVSKCEKYLRYVGDTEICGETCRVYHVLKGLKEMNNIEIWHFIEDLMSECYQNDIETMTPSEYRKMQQKYGD